MGRSAFRFIGLLASVLVAALVLLSRAQIVAAITEAEQSFLSLYFTPEELQVVSATRSLQSITRVAENITVVTATDIELMNAHTMEEVVNSVPGVTTSVAVQFVTGAAAQIQSQDIRRVTILLNGVPLNLLAENITILSTIPVQDIEKVEIIRGPTSSVWGSAMGGVINIITKTPGAKSFQGAASLDYGTENTGDYRAEVSGTVGRLGYRISGTNLRTDGLIEGFDADAWRLGARLDYAFNDRTAARLTLFYGDTDRGDGVDKQYDLAWRNHYKDYLVSELGIASTVGQAGRLDLSVWTTRYDNEYFVNQLSDGARVWQATYDERRAGAGLKYTVALERQSIVVGSDYSAGTLDASTIDGSNPDQDEWAVYANDTITFGNLTVTPGLRYDDISTADEFWSPSLGITYLLAKDTLFRATVARGFSAPNLASFADSEVTGYRANPDLVVEKMWSYQAGLESGILDTFWLKVTAFRHDVEDAFQDKELDEDHWTRVNAGNQRNLGLDLEARTRPIHGFTLAASACFLDVENTDTGEDMTDLPKEIYDISLKYDDLESLRGLVKGRYQQWDLTEGRDDDLSGLIVDVNLAKKFLVHAGVTFEGFFTIHNLLNENQYVSSIYPNPDRWYECGVRATF